MVKLELSRLTRRKLMNSFMTGLFTALTILSVLILAVIVINIFVNGISSINLDFFTQLPQAGGRGGIGNAIVGTLLMLLMASVVSVPLGVLIAIFLSEFGKGPFATATRFCVDLLLQTPSIVIGIFIWTTLVNGIDIGGFSTQIGFSAITGAIALSLIMIPIIARSVEEILRLVPDLLREAGLALGLPRWRVVTMVVIPTVRPGIITGVILSIARAAGETAPLLLTAGYLSNWSFNPADQAASITVMIYRYSTGIGDEPARAWGATLVLVVVIAIFSASVRVFSGKSKYEA
ncbi:MAG: phosphate ABC transporter permease PstA [Anaerolineae bacterium]|nr:phosphate ABC transporter permease PstA [Anaerolineae bacterium]